MNPITQLIPEYHRIKVYAARAAALLNQRITANPWPWITGSAIGLVVLFIPRKTSPLSYISSADRDKWFGPIRYIPAPRDNDPEAILITNNFAQRVVFRNFPIIGNIYIHELAADSLMKIMKEIEKKKWSAKVKRFNGSYVPRFMRGSTTNLSSHSYATSIDINAEENPMNSEPTADQKLLAPIFEKNGWYWGYRFTRKDPMHFEYILKPKLA